MIKNYIKTALRNILRYKLYSALNIIGLSVGIACAAMIFVIVQEEMNFNAHNEHADHIYRINKLYSMNGEISTNPSTPYPLENAARESFPEVLEAAHFVETSGIVKYEKDAFKERNICMASPSLFDIFTINITQGVKDNPINDLQSIAISQSMAAKYFGEDTAIGKILTLDNTDQLQVTAVYEDIPILTDYSFDFIINFDLIAEEEGYDDWYDHWMETFIRVDPNTDITDLQTKMDHLMKENIGDQSGARLQSLRNIHLYSVEGNPTTQKYVYIFVSIAILILIIACINFMNLATAQASKRAREVGVRKISGAQKFSLISQFIGEAIIYTFFACVISLILLEISLPIFEQIVGREIMLNLLHPQTLYLFGAIILIVGVVSGSYPAFILSSFSPSKIFKSGTSSSKKGLTLRTVIVIIQFTLAVALIIGTGIIYSQLNFMKNKDPGFDKDNVLYLRMNNELAENFSIFKDRCNQVPAIRHISRVSSRPNEVWSIMRGLNWSGSNTDEGSAFAFLSADKNILETIDLKLIMGRNFSEDMTTDDNSILINEAGAELIGLDDPIGLTFTEGDFTVIGVVKDFNSLPLTYEKEPLMIMHMPEYFRYVLMKINSSNISETLHQIGDIWAQVSPNFPFEIAFLDETFQHTYEAEIKAGILFRVFAGLGILIACLGLFGLASFLAEQKKLEIGIRRTLGSSALSIIWLLSRKFVRWIIVANLIAWPAAWYFMSKWLEGFAYKTNMNPFIFVTAGIVSVLIAMLTISLKTWKTANTNPADIIKYE